MIITERGNWVAYKPASTPEGFPAHALFARRADDGTDWYDFVHPGDNLRPDTVKMTVMSNNVVAAATTDASALFPVNALLLEVEGADTSNPQETYGGKIYNAADGTFTDPPPPERPPETMASLLKRIEALEAKG